MLVMIALAIGTFALVFTGSIIYAYSVSEAPLNSWVGHRPSDSFWIKWLQSHCPVCGCAIEDVWQKTILGYRFIQGHVLCTDGACSQYTVDDECQAIKAEREIIKAKKDAFARERQRMQFQKENEEWFGECQWCLKETQGHMYCTPQCFDHATGS